VSRLLVRCLNDKQDNLHYPPYYSFRKGQLYEASDYKKLWGIHDHKHNILTISKEELPEYFKVVSEDLVSYKLWSTHHFYAQTKRIANWVELKCPCSPFVIQKIALGKCNPIKIHHSWNVHLTWSCEFCGKQIPFEVDLNRKTIKPFELVEGVKNNASYN